MVSFRSPSGVVGLLPNGRTPWLINGGDPNYLRYLAAHPPSRAGDSLSDPS